MAFKKGGLPLTPNHCTGQFREKIQTPNMGFTLSFLLHRHLFLRKGAGSQEELPKDEMKRENREYAGNANASSL